jgi:hypothetical protein
MKGCTKLMYHARQRCMPTRNIGGPASLRFPSPDAPMKSPETGPPEANQASAHLHIDVRGRSTAQATPSSFPGRWLRLSAASVKRQGMLSAGMGVVECLEFRVRLDRACQLPQSSPTVHSLSTHLPQNRPACPKIDPPTPKSTH